MTVHLKKLSVGSESLASLRQWQAMRREAGQELMHVTRNTPRRAEEVLDGGSMFWVSMFWVSVSQRFWISMFQVSVFWVKSGRHK